LLSNLSWVWPSSEKKPTVRKAFTLATKNAVAADSTEESGVFTQTVQKQKG